MNFCLLGRWMFLISGVRDLFSAYGGRMSVILNFAARGPSAADHQVEPGYYLVVVQYKKCAGDVAGEG